VWKRTGADDERAGAAPEGATENAAFAVCLKAYPDTNREAYGAAGSRALSKRADYGTTEVVPFPVCGECGMVAAEQIKIKVKGNGRTVRSTRGGRLKPLLISERACGTPEAVP
jgi:hypothetical protein